jgi:hypothetical protein
MTTLALRVAPARMLFWPAALAALVLVAAGTGVVAPIVPMLGVVGLAALLGMRMQYSALALLSVALLADNPGERPMDGRWNSPLSGVGDLLYLNLHVHTGIEALRFSALELVIALLVVIVLARKLAHDPIDDPLGLGAVPNPLKIAFGAFFAAIVCLEAYGLGRGGDFRNSLWQVRQLFWLPVLGVLFGHAFKSAGARVGVLRALMAVAWLRAAMGLYFHFAIARPAGMEVEYVTTHSDSILTVVAMLIGLAALVERPSVQHVLLNLVLQPMLLMGLVVNDRRIAYVALAGGALTLVLMGPEALRRLLRRGVAVLVPVAVLYVAVGWHSSARVFSPVATLRSMAESDDASSQTRDIENFNLIQTLKRHPVLGSGLGHEYVEMVQANRVDQYFAQYRYIAHNSVLWLLSLSGWVGFTFIWMVFPMAVLIARRVHAIASSVTDRVTALATIAAVLSFVIQAWGDMGLQSWMGTLVMTSLMGATGAMFTAQQRAEVRA